MAPFMDRDKVTKPTAQIGFIKFVLIPMFETVMKVGHVYNRNRKKERQTDTYIHVHIHTYTDINRHLLKVRLVESENVPKKMKRLAIYNILH